MNMIFEADPTVQEYVEIIHDIQKKQKVARVKDIAQKRGVSRSSVSTVLNMLKKRKLVVHEQYGLVELTRRGEELGEYLDQRHQIIYDFLIKVLHMPENIAEADACKLEHHISTETVEYLKHFLDFLKKTKKHELLETFQQYLNCLNVQDNLY